jgi:hypothetical protein
MYRKGGIPIKPGFNALAITQLNAIVSWFQLGNL